MNYFYFAVAVLCQITVAIYIVYLYGRKRQDLIEKGGVGAFVPQYAFVAFFIFFYAPACILFPGWIGHKLGILEATYDDRILAIVFGTVSLAFSLGFGSWLSQRKKLLAAPK